MASPTSTSPTLIAFHRAAGRAGDRHRPCASRDASARSNSAPTATTACPASERSPNEDGDYINGGFFVVCPAAIDYIDGDDTVWEREPLGDPGREKASSPPIGIDGFWQNMDTLRDKLVLEDFWESGEAAWKIW